MKTCFKCGRSFPLSDFYKHSKMPDGHVNKCKNCNKNDVKNNRAENIKNPVWVKKERIRQREKTKLHGYEKRIGYIKKYPEKNAAKIASQRMQAPANGFHKHHWSYLPEHHKDVIWIRQENHINIHRYIVYDQERMLYRTFDTNILLSDKKSHLDFIKKFFLC